MVVAMAKEDETVCVAAQNRTVTCNVAWISTYASMLEMYRQHEFSLNSLFYCQMF